MSQSSFETLSKEVDQLGRLIGDVIREVAGDEGFELVESVRKMIRELRSGNREREEELDRVIANVDNLEMSEKPSESTFGITEDMDDAGSTRVGAKETATKSSETSTPCRARKSPGLTARPCMQSARRSGGWRGKWALLLA